MSVAINVATNEDAGSVSVDLLAGASDVDDSAVLNASNVSLSGDTAGASLSGNGLDIDTSAYDSLGANESATINATYEVTDEHGESVAQTASVIIAGENDEVSFAGGDTTGSVSEDDVLQVSGSLSATDVDLSDTLSWSVSGSAVGTFGSFAIDTDGNWNYTLNNDSDAVQDLDDGASATDSFDAIVSDGNGTSVSQSVTIDIAGAADSGVVNEDGEEVSTGFENGFTGWEIIGATSVVASNADEGNMARLDGTGASEGQIEAFLGADITNSYNGTTGSAIKTTLSLDAGDTVSFDWFFQANDYMPFNDFAVFMGTDGDMELLSNVAMVGDHGNSGWQTSELSIDTDGVYDIGFASIYAFDQVLWPQLFVDNLVIG